MTTKEIRKHTRAGSFDYSTSGLYFLTVCTVERNNILSRIRTEEEIDPFQTNNPVLRVELLKNGKIVKSSLDFISNNNPDYRIEKYVIMPNHLHILVWVLGNGSVALNENRANQMIPKFVSSFKRYTNKQAGIQMWQRSYYDHVIRDEKDYLHHLEYIENNPLKWAIDKYYRP